MPTKTSPLSTSINFYIESLLNSYAQVFFTKNRSLAILVILASFVNWRIGLGGLLAALATNIMASLLGFNRKNIQEGLFGLNSLMVAMGLALDYQFNSQFVLVFLAASLLCLFISVALLGYLSQLGVPFLSLPFLLTYWIIKLAIRQYDALEPSIDDVYTMNYLYALGGISFVQWYEYITYPDLPNILTAYFYSLAAVLFHGNLITGFLISIGLLISSRIAFSLSIIGYLAGYYFYYFVGADFSQLHYSYIGFNFILTAIAIGGFFFVPSWRTYVLVLLITPLIAILMAAFSTLLAPYQLPVLSLPFAVIVIMVIYTMQFATQHYFLKVIHQTYSPETNLYAYQNTSERFEGTTYFQLALPYLGEWTISQGHDGDLTHIGDWKHAWDFVIKDIEGDTFNNWGTKVEHFYCYNLPVMASAAGYVVEIVDNITDNEIGSVDLDNNWGNTIIIKHAEHLYTKISHLKEKSFRVKVGDYVKKGQLLAYLGNSGRSPEPHIHYQVQATPYVGSKTLKYPLAYYMKKLETGSFEFNMYNYPEEGDTIFNVKTTALLKDSFAFIPGKSLQFEIIEENKKPQIEEWKIWTNASGLTYFYCEKTKSTAYFVNDGTVHYFTSFEGDKSSLLYYFYLGCYRVLLGYYNNVQIKDIIPLHNVDRGIGKFVQDIIAPFKVYRKVVYQLDYSQIDNSMRPNKIELKSKVQQQNWSKVKESFDFDITIENKIIAEFSISWKGRKITAKQLGD